MTDGKQVADESPEIINQPEETKSAKMDSEKDTSGELFNTEPEQSEDLDLEVEEKEKPKETKPAAKEVAQEQIDSWVTKILTGKKTVEDIPKAQKWMVAPVAKELSKIQVSPDIDAIVEKKLAEREAEQNFGDMREQLNVLELSPLQKEELSKEFKSLTSVGVPKALALEKAVRIMGLDLNESAYKVDQMKAAMQIPKGGTPPQDDDLVDPEKLYKKIPGHTIEASKKRIDAIERMRLGNRATH